MSCHNEDRILPLTCFVLLPLARANDSLNSPRGKRHKFQPASRLKTAGTLQAPEIVKLVPLQRVRHFSKQRMRL